MASIERILIVGGGIAGLTVARAFHHQGFQAELVERSPSWQVTGAAIQLHPNGMRILHALGLGEAVEQAGAVVCYRMYCDQNGEVLCQANLEEVWSNLVLVLPSIVLGSRRFCLQVLPLSPTGSIPRSHP
jgi:FAD-dependent urate hydroxylase